MIVTGKDILAEYSKRELERRGVVRKLAVNNFYFFCQYLYPSLYPDSQPHLKKICDLMQDIVEHPLAQRGAIINTPPRFKKSLTCSLLSAWLLGRDMTGTVMRASYGASLAETLSYNVQQIICKREYLDIFPDVLLRKNHSPIDSWGLVTSHPTAYFCAGVCGAFTGNGATLIAIIDDQLKNYDQAVSTNLLEKEMEWYWSVFETRKERDCPELIIGTRWCMGDIAGYMLDTQAEKWKVLIIPAMDPETGLSTCPEILSQEKLEYFHDNEPIEIWSSVYMQHPVEEEGRLFKPSEMKFYNVKDLPKEKPMTTIGYIDTADRGKDFLSGLFASQYEQNGLWYLHPDVVFTQENMDVTKPLIVAACKRLNNRRLTVEANNGGREYARKLKEMFEKEHFWCKVFDRTHTTNKETRLIVLQPEVCDRICFPDIHDFPPTSDYAKFFRYLISYVKGKTDQPDDAPDSLIGLMEDIEKHFENKTRIVHKPQGL